MAHSHRNRNSAVLDALLARARGGRAGSAGGRCWRHESAVCCRFLLFGTPYSLGKCKYSHPPLEDTKRRRSSAAACKEAKELLEKERSRKEKMRAPEHPSALLYVDLQEVLAIHKINGNTKIEEIVKRKVAEIRENNEKNKVPYLPCRVCPELLPWSAAQREAHFRGRVHTAYKQMEEVCRV